MAEAKSVQLRKKLYLESLDYYRSHPDVFTEDVLEIKLNLYQKVLMRAFFRFDYNCWSLARGLGKSFLGILCIIVYCLLYPGTKAGIIAPAFRQAKNVIQEKYKDELCQFSPFIEQEEMTFISNTQKARIEFFNGSWIEGFPIGSDGSKIRGARLHVVLVDEAAYVPKFIIEQVIKPMMVVRRGYSVDKADENYENNKILLTSTASYRFNHLYALFCDYIKRMSEPDNTQYFACNLPYTVGLHVGLFDEEMIKQQKAVMSSIEFEMEYLARFPRISENAWIKYDDLINCSDLDHIETEGINGFEYVMSIDVARVEGHDNTIIDVFKLHWYTDHCEADMVYTDSMNGVSFENQAIKVREVLRKFPGIIKIYQDTMTIGQGLSDELAKDYYFAEEQKWYPPLIDCNNEQAMNKIDTTKGVPIIYGIRANAEINHKMGMTVKVFTEKNWVHLYPMSVDEKIDLKKEETRLVMETNAAIMEIVSIETTGVSGGWLQFGTKSRRKDRWSAMGMGLYGIQLLADERLSEDDELVMPILSRRR